MHHPFWRAFVALRLAAACFAFEAAVVSAQDFRAPVIENYHSSQSVVGGTVSYQVFATNNPTFAATGLPPGVTIAATTGLISGTPTAAGSFVARITATNPYGSANRDLTFQVLTPDQLPVITSAAEISGRVGEPMNHFIQATHSPQQFSATNVPPGMTLQVLTGVITGTPTQAGIYDMTLTATNAAGSRSAPLVFTVRPYVEAPRILDPLPPNIHRVPLGGTFSVSLNVVGSPPLTYRWFKQGDATPISTAPTLSLPNIQPSAEGVYHVEVRNDAGWTNGNWLTQLFVVVPPQISIQGGDRGSAPGGNAIFFVNVSGSDPMTYQWFKDGAALPGQTVAGLTLTNLTTAQAGVYTIRATNAAGTATSNAVTLHVGPPPQLTSGISDLQVRTGSTLALSLTATGEGPLTYEWRRDFGVIEGATSSTLTIPNAQPAHSGYYQGIVSNRFGSAGTSARITVTDNPVKVEIVGVRTKIYDGQPLVVSATSDPPGLPVQLRYTNGRFQLPGPPVDQGNYTAVAIIQDGTYDAMVSAELKILPRVTPVTLVGLHQTYDGTPRVVRATDSSGTMFIVEYDSSGVPPVQAGVYPLRFRVESANLSPDLAYKPMLVVDQAAQAITFDPLPASIAAGAAIQVRAAATSGLPVTLSLVSGSATLSGNTLTILGSGPVTVRATQPGNRNFLPATEDLTITAGRANQTITFAGLSDRVIDSGPIALNAQASSGLPVSFAVVGGPAGVSGSTLTVSPHEGVVLVRAIQPGDGTYNAAPSVVRSFRVRYATPPVITSHPVSRTVNAGDSVNFSIGASGNGTLEYFWFGERGTIVRTAVSSVTLNNVAPPGNGWYAAYVHNGITGIASNPATLTVQIPPFPGAAAPVITGITPDQTARLGDPVTLLVDANAGGLGAWYLWRKDGVPLGYTNVSHYAIHRFTAEDAGVYSVVVTTPGGSATSGNSTVRLGAGVNPSALPLITMSPTNAVTRVGALAQFSVTATGDALTYQWWRGDGVAIPGATTSTLAFPNPQLADADKYGVWVRDAAGNQSGGWAYLAVLTGNERVPPAGSGSSGTTTPPPAGVAPSIISQPAGGGFNAGSTVTLSVGIEGTAPFSYQWRREGTSIPGATNATLTFASIQGSDAGWYSVLVSNAAGQALSNATRIEVSSEPPSTLARPPAITTQPTAQAVTEGGTVTFAVNFTGSQPMAFQWRHNGVPLAHGHDATLVLYNVTPAKAGEYQVSLSNPYGGVTSANATLTVTPATNTPPPPSGTWLEQNVGGALPAGSVTGSDDVVTVRGGGADIWDVADSFFFRCQGLTGDVEITARVTSLQDTHAWAKAGVMIRESNAPGARSVMLLVTPSFISALQYRALQNGTTVSAGNHWLSAPRWLRLSRSGNTFTAYQSADGTTWTRMSSVDIEMPAAVFAGLAVTSHVNGTATTATFDGVSVSGAASTPPPATPPPAGSLPAPSGLTATVMSSTAVTLNWVDNASSETGFDIQRSTDNTTFTSIAAVGANVTSFANLGLNASTTYYYRVRTTQGTTLSAFSNVAAGTTPAAVPSTPTASWQTTDVGGVAAAGTSSDSDGVVTLRGSGADIWDAADEFHFRYVSFAGDGEIVARLTGLTDTHGWAKAGLMFRENLTSSSRHAFMGVSAGNGVAFQRRTITNGPSDSTSGSRSTAPRWLRLVRAGNSFTGYESADGATWTQVGSATIEMPGTVNVGLAVTSHNDGVVCTATFTNVSAPGGTAAPPGSSPPPAPTALSGSAMSTTAITLTWTDNSTNETGFAIERSLDNVTFQSSGTVAANSSTATIAGLNAATVYHFRVRAVAGTLLSAFTNTFTVSTLAAPPPSGTTGTWETRDIGAVAAAGSAGESGGVVTLAGSGADIWDTADEFRFRYLTITGDGEIVARLTGLTDTHGWAKAGVMFRETLTPGSRHVFMCVSAGQGSAFQRRTTTGGFSESTPGRVTSTLPRWVRLVRSGNVFTAYDSVDGATWNTIESVTLALPATLNVGLAVTSHNDGVLCTATFGSVNVSGGGVPPPPPPVISPPPGGTLPAPSELTAVAISPTEVRLTWRDNSSDEQEFSLERSTDNLSFQPLQPINAGVTTLVDGSRTSGATYYYRIRAMSATAISPYSNTAVVTTPASPVVPTSSWSRTDVGAPAIPGSMEASGNTITLRGSGADIWGTADAFHFVYRVMSGDFVIETQVSSIVDTHAWAKAGVMIRESLAANSPNVFLFLTPFNGIGLQLRSDLSDPRTVFQSGPWGIMPPYWVRLVRTGSEVASFISRDGTTWTPMARHGLPATAPLYVGFAVTSHDDTKLTTAVFTDPFIQ